MMNNEKNEGDSVVMMREREKDSARCRKIYEEHYYFSSYIK